MPFSPAPDATGLCEACRELAPGRRGHTFLVPYRRDGQPGPFVCLQCRAVWETRTTETARHWVLVSIEQKDSTES